MRGKRFSILSVARKYRITPAGAGKTAIVIIIYALIWDHPRRCGENNPHREQYHTTLGSPPQVRGKLGYESNRKFP